MLGQASRFLVKLIAKVSQGGQVDFPFTYLNRMQETLAQKNQANSVDDFLNIDVLDRALQARVCHLISTTMQDYN